jgi:MoaA/NifB/PqqE/SkfB family radical SAM enzyme
MKLISVYTESHESLKDRWFLPTLKDDYDISVHRCEARGHGIFMETDWTEAVCFKAQKIIQAIEESWGSIFVYSDVDIQFFAPTKERILQALANKDIVCQLDAPGGRLCTGFFAARANALTLRLWEEVHEAVKIEHRDQSAFNRIVREIEEIRYGYLPVQFFGTGTFTGKRWSPGCKLYIPPSPLMYHANWTIGIDNKVALLKQVRRVVTRGNMGILANDLRLCLPPGINGFSGVAALRRTERFLRTKAAHSHTNPRSVCLDASTVCQLKCPSCPTSNGAVAKGIGSGCLRFDAFKKFINQNRHVLNIELSNWGEIFLNPALKRIMEYAYRKGITLTADNGVNLNRASDDILEALVKYRLRRLSCSIDGASQEVYSAYRVNGNYRRVVEHIERINYYKKKYRSSYPSLRWQFIAFGHNEHEIRTARQVANKLDMRFYLKLSWDDLYTSSFSPVEDRELIRNESGLGVADRKEFEEKYGRSYVSKTCHQLWLYPRINYDGKLLGCSINHWGNFGNVFEGNLDELLNGETMSYAKKMLLGLKKKREDIPCSNCKIYDGMKENQSWVNPEDLNGHYEKRSKTGILNGLKKRGLTVRNLRDGQPLFSKANRV